MIIPEKTHGKDGVSELLPYNYIKEIKNNFPSPFDRKSKQTVSDIQYAITLNQDQITDHFSPLDKIA